MNKSDIFVSYIESVIFRNVKITRSCDVTSCIACSVQDLKDTENVLYRKLNVLPLIWNLFYSWEMIFEKFNSCFAIVKISKFLSNSWKKIRIQRLNYLISSIYSFFFALFHYCNFFLFILLNSRPGEDLQPPYPPLLFANDVHHLHNL